MVITETQSYHVITETQSYHVVWHIYNEYLILIHECYRIEVLKQTSLFR